MIFVLLWNISKFLPVTCCFVHQCAEEAEGTAEPTAMTLPSEGLVNTHNIKTLKMLEYG